jgi:hypothetical protein
MSNSWVPYVVQQGDHLSRLAFRFGSDEETIWSNEQNKDLAARRKNRHTLCPGDVLWVPGEAAPPLALAVGSANSYRAVVPKVPVKLHLDPKQRPVAGKAFEVHGAGGADPLRGTVSDEGEIAFEVPVLVREVDVQVREIGLRVRLHVGDLDPLEEPSGVTQRLRNLGYLSRSGAVSDETRAQAIRAFQLDHHLEADGILNEATLEALRDAHKS